ncbi:hypothetical protein CY35_02G122700 [Sphagnum magellanicum]|nr:hypothetical protein CY35_02G122700 [Sphagnum magellanicum]
MAELSHHTGKGLEDLCAILKARDVMVEQLCLDLSRCPWHIRIIHVNRILDGQRDITECDIRASDSAFDMLQEHEDLIQAVGGSTNVKYIWVLCELDSRPLFCVQLCRALCVNHTVSALRFEINGSGLSGTQKYFGMILEQVPEMFQSNKGLKYFACNYSAPIWSHMVTWYLDDFADALKNNHTLEHLEMSGINVFSGRGLIQGLTLPLTADANGRQTNSTLVKLHLTLCKEVKGESLKAIVDSLARMLQSNTSLKELHFCSSKDYSVATFEDALRMNHTLENLGLAGRLRDLERLLQPLTVDANGNQSNTTLMKLMLTIGAKPIEVEHPSTIVDSLTKMLQRNSSLKELSFSGTEIFIESDVSALIKSLEKNYSLEILNLEGCKGVSGCVFPIIMDMLVVNKTLKEINLERTTLYEEVGTQMEAVKQELEKNAAIHKESMSTFKELPMSKATSTSVLLCSIPSTENEEVTSSSEEEVKANDSEEEVEADDSEEEVEADDRKGRWWRTVKSWWRLMTVKRRWRPMTVKRMWRSRMYHLTKVDGPSWYLELGTKSLKNIENMISIQSSNSVLINQLQCHYLFDKLRESLNDAKACIDGLSPQDIQRSYCILENLAQTWKEGEILVGDCCDAQWIRVAMILANAKEHFKSLIFKLRLYMQLFQSIFKEGATKEFLIRLQDRKWSDDVKDEEFPIIDEKALEDQQWLLSRLIKVGSTDSENLIKRLNHPGKIDAWKVAHKSIQRVPYGQIGKGTSAIVHKVEWLGKHFAEKCFFGPESEHFQKEASLLAGLSHPNILPLFCFVTRANSCSLVTELMDGDLHGLMRRRLDNHEIQGVPFKLLEAIDIMLQVAEGMHYLHQNRVVHRDLKSTNILVKCDEHDGHVYAKVADFGLSKTKESSCTYSNLTMDHGTTRWMAPELFGNFDQSVPIQVCQETQHPSLSNEHISRRYPFKVDIYSFGMVCYEILTGNIPFHNHIAMTELRTKIKDGLRPNLPDQCPQQLSKLIQECYHPDPATRPSFFEICLELRHIMCSLMIGCTL